jgi:cytochrome c556
MFHTRLLTFVAVGMVALSAGSGPAQPKPLDGPSEKPLMDKKRTRAHAILDALTAGDHAAVKQEALGMADLAERAIFLNAQKGANPNYKTEEYVFQVEKFKHAVADLMAAAEAKNIDGAALAYSDMTRTCVKCHTHFRGLKK